MPLPPDYIPRKGDLLIAYFQVRHQTADGEQLFGHFVGREYDTALMAFEHLHGLHRRAWEEGDKVRLIERRLATGTVRAVFGDYVWIECTDASDPFRGMITMHANSLEEAVEPEGPSDIPFATKEELIAAGNEAKPGDYFEKADKPELPMRRLAAMAGTLVGSVHTPESEDDI